MLNKRVLVTGGAGYIGSHTILQLLDHDYQVTILDNLSNSKYEVIKRLEEISSKTVEFHEGDILDVKLMEALLTQNQFDSIIHFAGLKSVSESENNPSLYYKNNVAGSILLIDLMLAHNINKFIFSSSATVYGDPGYAKCDETTPLNPISIYGKTKYLVEEFIRDVAQKNHNFNFSILRYFNPVGAHHSGLIGEDPNGIPNNLLPFISQVAIGKRSELKIWGNDYSTMDGTGRRDYIHVEDLAAGHIAALEYLNSGQQCNTFNLGTGNSHSVLEVIKAFEKVSNKKIPYKFAGRRPGDVAENFADPSLAKELLKWETQFNLEKMCEDAWNWQTKNPNGYSK